jgi:hypothetical protein
MVNWTTHRDPARDEILEEAVDEFAERAADAECTTWLSLETHRLVMDLNLGRAFIDEVGRRYGLESDMYDNALEMFGSLRS